MPMGRGPWDAGRPGGRLLSWAGSVSGSACGGGAASVAARATVAFDSSGTLSGAIGWVEIQLPLERFLVHLF